jgi:hypothetical protein
MKNKLGEEDCYSQLFELSWNMKGICRLCIDKDICRTLVLIPVYESKYTITFLLKTDEYDEAKVNK